MDWSRGLKIKCCIIYVSFILISAFSSFSFSKLRLQENQKPAFQFLTQDSVEIQVFEVFDADSTLNIYKALVNTPICEEEKCYVVELVYYWDVIGSFLKYDLVPGKPLTKLDHEPFIEADYQKLTQILKKEHPAFINLKKDELIIKIKNDSIDGVSGATVAAIEDEIVPGAAYSCYTLWHIANGPVVQSIKNHIKISLNQKLVRKLVSSNKIDTHYFLVNSFDERGFESYLQEVLKLIKINEGYFVKNAIKFPDLIGKNQKIN